MAAKTASLSVNVIADAAKAKAGLKDAQGAFGKFGDSVKQAEGTVNKFKAGSGAALDIVKKNAATFAAAAGASIVAFGIKSVNAFQDLALSAGKFSEATGMAVQDASRLIEVAGDIGVELGSVEKAVSFMNKSMGKSPELFKELGVQVRYAKDGTTDVNATFLEVVNRLNGIKDPAERAAVAAQLLGKGWADMAELIAVGSDGLSESLSQVSDAKVIDESEVIKAREFRDALDNLKGNFEDFALTIGETVVPALSGAMKAFDVMPDSMKKTVTNMGLTLVAAAALQKGFESLGVSTQTTATVIGGFKTVLFGLTLATGILDFMNEISGAAGNSNTKLQNLAVAIDSVRNGSMRSVDPLKEFRDLVAAEGKKANLANIIRDVGKEVTIIGGSIGRDIEYIDQAFNKLLSSSPKAAQSLLNIWTSQTNALDKSSQQYKDNIMLIERFQDRLNLTTKSAQAFKNLNDESSKIVPVLKNIVGATDNVESSWAKARNTFFDSRFVSQNLINVWRKGYVELVAAGDASENLKNTWVKGHGTFVESEKVSKDLASAWRQGEPVFIRSKESSDFLINAWREGYQALRKADSITVDLKDSWHESSIAFTNGRTASDELTASVSKMGAQALVSSTFVDGLSAEWQSFLGLLDKRDAFENAQAAITDYEETFKKAAKGNKQAQEEVNEKLRQGQREIAKAMELADLIPKEQAKKILFLTDTGQLSAALSLLKQVDAMYQSVETARQRAGTQSGMGSGRLPPGLDFSGFATKRAAGGVITKPEFAMIGEAGAEAIIPLTNPTRAMELMQASGLDMLAMSGSRGGGGTTVINVSVDAGLVSSPDQVGQQIIEAIRRAERRSGQVFVAA